jgi:hypothetical protein
MNRRFGVPSSQHHSRPQRRVQHLPDDFASFIPTNPAPGNLLAVPQPAILAPAFSAADSPSTRAALSPAQSVPPPPSSPEGIRPAELATGSVPLPVTPPVQRTVVNVQPPAPPIKPASQEIRPTRTTLPAATENPESPSVSAIPSLRALAAVTSKILKRKTELHAAEKFLFADLPCFDPDFDSLAEPARGSEVSSRANPPSRRGARRARPAHESGGSQVQSLHRHRRKCAICNHPEREMIEFYFINWRSPYTIASDFRLNNTSAVYRHARALDLFPRRSKNIRAMLEILFEKAGGVQLTADALVRAVRTYASLGDGGEWVEPATTHVISTPASTRQPQPAPLSRSDRPEFGSASPGHLPPTPVSASRTSDSPRTSPQKTAQKRKSNKLR